MMPFKPVVTFQQSLVNPSAAGHGCQRERRKRRRIERKNTEQVKEAIMYLEMKQEGEGRGERMGDTG